MVVVIVEKSLFNIKNKKGIAAWKLVVLAVVAIIHRNGDTFKTRCSGWDSESNSWVLFSRRRRWHLLPHRKATNPQRQHSPSPGMASGIVYSSNSA